MDLRELNSEILEVIDERSGGGIENRFSKFIYMDAADTEMRG
jgi:hypothetical protein